MKKHSHGVVGLLFILGCVVAGVALFVMTHDQSPRASDGQLTNATAMPLDEGRPTAAGPDENGPAAAGDVAAEVARPSVASLSAQALVGTWGPASYNPSGNPNSACDTDNIVTFKADGTYRDGGSYGRYRVSGSSITYYDRVKYDLGEDTEDRSEFDTPLTTSAILLDRHTLREDGALLKRCRSG